MLGFYDQGIPISPTPVSPTPILPTPVSPTPVLPTLKFYLIPVSPKRPHGRAVSAPDFGSRGRGFESRWRRDSSQPKRRFIAQSLSCSPFHRLEMTEILLKGRKTLTHPSIHPVSPTLVFFFFFFFFFFCHTLLAVRGVRVKHVMYDQGMQSSDSCVQEDKLQHYATAYRNHKNAGEKLGLFRFCKFFMYFFSKYITACSEITFLTE